MRPQFPRHYKGVLTSPRRTGQHAHPSPPRSRSLSSVRFFVTTVSTFGRLHADRRCLRESYVFPVVQSQLFDTEEGLRHDTTLLHLSGLRPWVSTPVPGVWKMIGAHYTVQPCVENRTKRGDGYSRHCRGRVSPTL